MKTGFVAIIDALGFKGIWRSFPADQVLTKLVRMAIGTSFDLAVRRPQASFANPEDKAVDRMVRRAVDHGRAWAWASVASRHPRTVGHVLDLGAAEQPTLAYRGCVTSGEFDAVESFLVGPAVDEAAGDAQHADGAFVWLTDSATVQYGEAVRNPVYMTETWEAIARVTSTLEAQSAKDVASLTGDDPLIVHYAVPMKDLGTRACPVLNPFALVPRFRREEFEARLIATFDRSTDASVARKQAHTASFFERAREEAP